MSVFKVFNKKRLKSSKDKDWNRGTWYIWKRINGRVIHHSLPEALTKEDAEKAERKIVQDAFNRKYGVTQTVGFVEFANGPYTRYFESVNTNIGAKRLYVKRLCEAFKGKNLDDITPQDCRDVQAKFKKTTSASSVNRIMSTLSKMLTIACEEGILDRNPMQHVRKLKEPPKRTRLLTKEEKEKLWNALTEDPLMYRLVSLAVNLPLRRGQILAIIPDAIDQQNGVLFTVSSKGREPRMVPLNSTALNILQLMIQDGQLPFPLKDFRKRWAKITQAAGINEKGGKRGENFTFHDLRKEFASELIRRKANPKTVQHLFAHSDMSITDIYIQEDFEQMREAVNILDSEVIE